MAQIVIYQFPGACSRVTMTALEEIGLPYEERVVNLRRQEQQSNNYLNVNPKGKVPAVDFNGRVMTESAAILAFLHREHPEAHLLPTSFDPVEANQGLVDLVWCSCTIHPIVRQVRMPMKFTTTDTEGVKADGLQKLAAECAILASRLERGRWWYGDVWSIIDVYIYWALSTAAKGGFPIANYPALVEHTAGVRDRPSFKRALAREVLSVHREGLDVAIEQL
jgi:glutathione S-transferase